MNIYGASGHAKVIIEIAKSQGDKINFVIDDNKEINEVLGYKVVHEFISEMHMYNSILAVGNNKTRKKLSESFNGKYYESLNHSSSVVSPSAKLGNGTVVMANASINAHTTIGEHCIINTAAAIDHDCVIGDFVHISPQAALAGDVMVGEGSHIGIGAVIIPGIKIGKWATIGAGTVVINDVPDFATVVGNPGKIIKISN